MNFTRRSFLKSLPAAPLAAKQLEAAALSGTAVAGPDSIDEDLMDALYSQRSRKKDLERAKKVLDILGKAGAIPEWKMKAIRRNAKNSRLLDPDIAAMQSISLQYKLRMQWDRNEKRLIDQLLWNPIRDIEETSWLEKFGLDWF